MKFVYKLKTFTNIASSKLVWNSRTFNSSGDFIDYDTVLNIQCVTMPNRNYLSAANHIVYPCQEMFEKKTKKKTGMYPVNPKVPLNFRYTEKYQVDFAHT